MSSSTIYQYKSIFHKNTDETANLTPDFMLMKRLSYLM